MSIWKALGQPQYHGLHIAMFVVAILGLINIALVAFEFRSGLQSSLPPPLEVHSAVFQKDRAVPGEKIFLALEVVKIRHCENNVVRRWLQGGPNRISIMIDEFEAGDFTLGAKNFSVPVVIPEDTEPGKYFVMSTSEYKCPEGKRSAKPFLAGPIEVVEAE